MTENEASGLIISAPSSGSGKTVVTLALLRAFKNANYNMCGAKAGPDYIDPQFHAVASGSPALNLDPWAMEPSRLSQLFHAGTSNVVLVEGMMGLFDGAADGSGSVAELSKALGLPVILIVDAAHQSHSIAALVKGFCEFDPKVNVCGVILNRVGSKRHEAMLRNALDKIGVRVFGAIHRNECMVLPERHLGLVQAGEIDRLETLIEEAAAFVSKQVDLEAIEQSFSQSCETGQNTNLVSPLGQSIAVAKDEAFAFTYPHLLMDWRKQGANVSFFSPLNDEGPDPNADAVYLPGGYPELHCERLAEAANFKNTMQATRDRGSFIYGECGGYMVLGEGIIDKEGQGHAMLGLLQLETSFANRKLHLGYRRISAPGFVMGERLNGHEFHYTSVVKQEGDPLFEVTDALGENRTKVGLKQNNVMGSYIHVICRDAS